MKKQNLLMYAFVAFLFICLLVKPFWTFPMWDAFVIAISCASYFLHSVTILMNMLTDYFSMRKCTSGT